jgi:hypothetical protein
LLTELTNDLLAKARGLRENIVEPVEHLFQIFGLMGPSAIRADKDYVIRVETVKLYC